MAENADLKARLAECELERGTLRLDKSRMLDERQIFMRGMDELRAKLADCERAHDEAVEAELVMRDTAEALEREVIELRAQLTETRKMLLRKSSTN